MSPESILDFWFNELSSKQQFSKDPVLDQMIRNRYLDALKSASQCELFGWRTSPQGRLAEILILDQFSRNIYRNSAQAFAQDRLALALAQELIERGDDLQLNTVQRPFAYMPFMHSESALIHEQAVKLFSQIGLEQSLRFEIRHKAIIDRFGRYPHRNELLGRESTPDELSFLKESGSSF